MSLSGHRPIPRRKSSGGNLLAAFSSKPPPVSFQSPPPPQPTASSSRTQPPTPTQPRRSNSGGPAGDADSDTMSVSSFGGVPPPPPPPPSLAGGSSIGAGGSSVNGAALDAERLTQEVFARRCEWIHYLKEAHEGDLYFAGTFRFEVDSLARCLDPAKMKARANSYALLGMSISGLLDIPVAGDFVKALTKLLDEYDALAGGRDEVAGSGGSGGAKMKNMFKGSSSKNGKRPSGSAGMEYATGLGGGGESGEITYLLTPNQPFPLHYFQVLPTFLDILLEVYIKLNRFLWGTYPARDCASSSKLDGLPLPLAQQLAAIDAEVRAELEREWEAEESGVVGTTSKEAPTAPLPPPPPSARSSTGAGGVGSRGMPPAVGPVSPPKVPILPRGSRGSLGVASGGGGGGSTTPAYTPTVSSYPPSLGGRTFSDGGDKEGGGRPDGWKELGEPVQKIDARFKKIFTRLELELESIHKRLIREELSSLESLLTSSDPQTDLFMPSSPTGTGLHNPFQTSGDWYRETDSAFALGIGERAREARDAEGLGLGAEGLGQGGDATMRVEGGKGSTASAWDEGESLSFDRAVFA